MVESTRSNSSAASNPAVGRLSSYSTGNSRTADTDNRTDDGTGASRNNTPTQSLRPGERGSALPDAGANRNGTTRGTDTVQISRSLTGGANTTPRNALDTAVANDKGKGKKDGTDGKDKSADDRGDAGKKKDTDGTRGKKDNDKADSDGKSGGKSGGNGGDSIGTTGGGDGGVGAGASAAAESTIPAEAVVAAGGAGAPASQPAISSDVMAQLMSLLGMLGVPGAGLGGLGSGSSLPGMSSGSLTSLISGGMPVLGGTPGDPMGLGQIGSLTNLASGIAKTGITPSTATGGAGNPLAAAAGLGSPLSIASSFQNSQGGLVSGILGPGLTSQVGNIIATRGGAVNNLLGSNLK